MRIGVALGLEIYRHSWRTLFLKNTLAVGGLGGRLSRHA